MRFFDALHKKEALGGVTDGAATGSPTAGAPTVLPFAIAFWPETMPWAKA